MFDDYDIVSTFGAEYRGVIGYCRLATDVWRLGDLHWYAETSMLKTLAAKHQSTVSKMATRYKAKISTSNHTGWTKLLVKAMLPFDLPVPEPCQDAYCRRAGSAPGSCTSGALCCRVRAVAVQPSSINRNI